MKLSMIRVGNSLVPDGDEAIAEFEKLPRDKELFAEVTRPRNIKHLRLYWKLCQRIGLGIGKPAEWVSDALKIETENYKAFKYGGKVHIVLGSIAVAKMDDIAFREWFENCVQIIYRQWGIDPASVADLLAPKTEKRS